LLRLATDLEEFGKVEAMPVLEGKRMIMFIAPKKKKNKSVSSSLYNELTILEKIR
jgi:hypothetical protein